jgi:hypothetical protein
MTHGGQGIKFYKITVRKIDGTKSMVTNRNRQQDFIKT